MKIKNLKKNLLLLTSAFALVSVSNTHGAGVAGTSPTPQQVSEFMLQVKQIKVSEVMLQIQQIKNAPNTSNKNDHNELQGVQLQVAQKLEMLTMSEDENVLKDTLTHLEALYGKSIGPQSSMESDPFVRHVKMTIWLLDYRINTEIPKAKVLRSQIDQYVNLQNHDPDTLLKMHQKLPEFGSPQALSILGPYGDQNFMTQDPAKFKAFISQQQEKVKLDKILQEKIKQQLIEESNLISDIKAYVTYTDNDINNDKVIKAFFDRAQNLQYTDQLRSFLRSEDSVKSLDVFKQAINKQRQLIENDARGLCAFLKRKQKVRDEGALKDALPHFKRLIESPRAYKVLSEELPTILTELEATAKHLALHKDNEITALHASNMLKTINIMRADLANPKLPGMQNIHVIVPVVQSQPVIPSPNISTLQKE